LKTESEIVEHVSCCHPAEKKLSRLVKGRGSGGATEKENTRRLYVGNRKFAILKNLKSDVLVVGAGPVGLTAALELNRRGAGVRLIEKSTDRGQLSKAVGINARSLTLLEPSGVTAKLLAAGLKIKHINLRSGDDILARVDFSELPGPYKFMLSLPQSDTEDLLEQALSERDITVERGTELVGFTQSAKRIDARLSANGTLSDLSADSIIGCDGAHSTVRKTLGLGFAGERYPETWSLADVRMDWRFGHGEGNLFMGDCGGVVFVIALPEDRYRVIANAPDVLSLLPSGSNVTEVLWQTDFTVSLRQVDAYGKGRAFLAGDAAHIHTPAGGRGMNLGIEDACEFSERLSLGTLDGYSEERHRVGRQVIKESDLQFRMASIGNPVLKILRNSVLRNVFSTEFVQSRFRLRMAGLKAAS
jgi:2-polyprenyl-6-methoxyphenol hydroxylase-like FAD-dependent oxidoreductase